MTGGDIGIIVTLFFHSFTHFIHRNGLINHGFLCCPQQSFGRFLVSDGFSSGQHIGVPLIFLWIQYFILNHKQMLEGA